MPIEVTSVPERGWKFFPKNFNAFRDTKHLTDRQIAGRLIALLIAILAVMGGDALVRSYRYYARIIDARLAHGYLTSRPGLYASSRELRVGQGLSVKELTETLQRAGYVESAASDVWNGSFSQHESTVEVRPSTGGITGGPRLVRVEISDKGKISEITGDDLTLDSFSLEPEVISNDHSSKSGRNKVLTYSEIPPVLVHAILAIEDRRFFDHSGVDVFGLARALFNNASDERNGQGGSTITQQLVKNTYLSPEKTFRRKYAEAMLAIALERRLSKQDIFALYCNEIYLGQRGAAGARGVEQAAHNYFGKDLKDLSLSEAATIAGMIQGPGRYSPDRHPEATLARRNVVLAAMTQSGWIGEDQLLAATHQPLGIIQLEHSSSTLAPYFIDYVNRVAESQLDVSSDTSRLYTTIDLDLQRLAEAALKRQLEKLDGVYKNGKKPEAALVALDPHSGNVLAMVGGRDYSQSQLNRATDARRQPGSTFKPFVYAAALEDGMSPLQMFADAPRDFVYDRKRVYRPANYGGAYSYQDVTMRSALIRSLNVVTVDIAMRTGLTRIANLAEKFGLPRPERYPSLALGTTEVTPLQLAAAYAAFVNGGHRVEPKVVTSVSEPPATHMLSSEGEQVVSPTTAYMMTNILSGVVDTGTARRARNSVKGTAIAGKTGTSHDGWFVGYTPNMVCVVWIGFDDNSQLGLTGASSALPVWSEFVSEAVSLRPDLGGRAFECPEGIKFVEIDAQTGLLSTLACPNRELVAVTERTTPNLECFRHANLPQPSLPEQPVHVQTQETVIAQKKRDKRDVIAVEFNNLKSTRVDVDARGKRTLVNDLR